MKLSRACVRQMLFDAQNAELVDAQFDASAKCSARSQPPLVFWLKTAPRLAPTPRLMRRMDALTHAFQVHCSAVGDHRYTPTGTPPNLAGAIQVLSTWGRGT